MGRFICLRERIWQGVGKYAGRLLKGSYAVQPKGCSACFWIGFVQIIARVVKS